MTREEALNVLIKKPYKFGHLLGFTKLTELHNTWIRDMVLGTDDATLQAHRGSYKTTCVSIALALIIVLQPQETIIFMRKGQADCVEVVSQVKKILESDTTKYFVRAIYGIDLQLTVSNAMEISTNLVQGVKGQSQLIAFGIGASLTGRHASRIFTDDIVNLTDRISRAERLHTRQIYQELQNLKNRDGRIYNTGTPWHADDAFTLMPEARKYDCYQTGLISPEQLSEIKGKMAPTLFAANYELRHIASDDVLFPSPQTGTDPARCENGIMHIDAAYGGSDFTAVTICRRDGENYYVYGKLWQKHVDDCIPGIIALCKQFLVGTVYCEDNGDKGYLGKALRQKLDGGEKVRIYHESTNKHIKISSVLKPAWAHVMFCAGTDTEYINQIADYTENADHDDAPDGLACSVRILSKKGANAGESRNNAAGYFL